MDSNTTTAEERILLAETQRPKHECEETILPDLFKGYNQARERPDWDEWKKAIRKELKDLFRFGTFKRWQQKRKQGSNTPMPNQLGTVWVFKVKEIQTDPS